MPRRRVDGAEFRPGGGRRTTVAVTMRAVAIGGELRAIVETLAVEIGPRSVYRPAAMARAVEFLTREASLPGEGERALV